MENPTELAEKLIKSMGLDYHITGLQVENINVMISSPYLWSNDGIKKLDIHLAVCCVPKDNASDNILVAKFNEAMAKLPKKNL